MAEKRTANDSPEASTPDGLSLRPARMEDHDFCLRFYLEAMEPLMIALGLWDKNAVLERFAKGFKLEQIQVLCMDGADVGWMQVSVSDKQVHLDQLHLIEAFRNRLIGTHLIRRLQERASAAGKPVALHVIHGNRAKGLYERLGFRVVKSDEEKVWMLWKPESGPRPGSRSSP